MLPTLTAAPSDRSGTIALLATFNTCCYYHSGSINHALLYANTCLDGFWFVTLYQPNQDAATHGSTWILVGLDVQTIHFRLLPTQRLRTFACWFYTHTDFLLAVLQPFVPNFLPPDLFLPAAIPLTTHVHTCRGWLFWAPPIHLRAVLFILARSLPIRGRHIALALVGLPTFALVL